MESGDIPRVIKRALPNAVTYDMASPGIVKVSLPQTSTWTSGLHWHENHTEYLKVIRGNIRVRLGDREQTISASRDNQPEIKINRYTWHEWQRAELDGEEVVVIERTDPADGEKALFFWNLNGVILNAPKLLEDKRSFISRCPERMRGMLLDSWITLNLFVIFYYLDNVPVFINVLDLAGHSGPAVDNAMARKLLVGVDWAFSHVVLYLASIAGWMLNVRAVRLKYTPPSEYATWVDAQNRHLKSKSN